MAPHAKRKLPLKPAPSSKRRQIFSDTATTDRNAGHDHGASSTHEESDSDTIVVRHRRHRPKALCVHPIESSPSHRLSDSVSPSAEHDPHAPQGVVRSLTFDRPAKKVSSELAPTSKDDLPDERAPQHLTPTVLEGRQSPEVKYVASTLRINRNASNQPRSPTEMEDRVPDNTHQPFHEKHFDGGENDPIVISDDSDEDLLSFGAHQTVVRPPSPKQHTARRAGARSISPSSSSSRSSSARLTTGRNPPWEPINLEATGTSQVAHETCTQLTSVSGDGHFRNCAAQHIASDVSGQILPSETKLEASTQSNGATETDWCPGKTKQALQERIAQGSREYPMNITDNSDGAYGSVEPRQACARLSAGERHATVRLNSPSRLPSMVTSTTEPDQNHGHVNLERRSPFHDTRGSSTQAAHICKEKSPRRSAPKHSTPAVFGLTQVPTLTHKAPIQPDPAINNVGSSGDTDETFKGVCPNDDKCALNNATDSEELHASSPALRNLIADAGSLQRLKKTHKTLWPWLRLEGLDVDQIRLKLKVLKKLVDALAEADKRGEQNAQGTNARARHFQGKILAHPDLDGFFDPGAISLVEQYITGPYFRSRKFQGNTAKGRAAAKDTAVSDDYDRPGTPDEDPTPTRMVEVQAFHIVDGNNLPRDAKFKGYLLEADTRDESIFLQLLGEHHTPAELEGVRIYLQYELRQTYVLTAPGGSSHRRPQKPFERRSYLLFYVLKEDQQSGFAYEESIDNWADVTARVQSDSCKDISSQSRALIPNTRSLSARFIDDPQQGRRTDLMSSASRFYEQTSLTPVDGHDWKSHRSHSNRQDYDTSAHTQLPPHGTNTSRQTNFQAPTAIMVSQKSSCGLNVPFHGLPLPPAHPLDPRAMFRVPETDVHSRTSPYFAPLQHDFQDHAVDVHGTETAMPLTAVRDHDISRNSLIPAGASLPHTQS